MPARTLAGLIAVSLAIFSSPALAEPVCGPRDVIVKALEKEFHETAIFRGLSMDGRIMYEVYASPEGTWTVVLSNPTGTACVREAGQGGMVLPQGTPA